ncbi:MAG: type I restriction enzyme HsdR N-terminal domain-containing protein [Clostridiales Family XIII bacterium]|jgi:hypothetical protein|nr:type I restriction enzyme HsdR N-terminal domain-containing protein [Clostridiales Family XIII bacterium]
MTFAETFAAFADKAKALRPFIQSEAGTKTSLVLPFFRLLGYDVDDPRVFVPELKADFRQNGGNCVDYALLREGKPVIIVEVKHCDVTLDQHAGQLAGYFAPIAPKFAVLTNGYTYRFYSDVMKAHIMDSEPFLKIDLLSLDERAVAELELFSAARFDIAAATQRAQELQHEKLIYMRLSEEIENPSPSFVLLLAAGAFAGKASAADVGRLKPIVAKAITRYIADNAKEQTAELEPTEIGPVNDATHSPDELKAFDWVKYCVESTGSEHRYKLRLNKCKGFSAAYYRNCHLVSFVTNDAGDVVAIRVMGTTLQTRKSKSTYSIMGLDELANYSDVLYKHLEFINWWYLNPESETGGIE